MLLATTNSLDGHRITRYLEVVGVASSENVLATHVSLLRRRY